VLSQAVVWSALAAPAVLWSLRGDQVESVQLRRQGREILQQPALSVLPGEWLLLCGPSGAGKSSLLAGLEGSAGARPATRARRWLEPVAGAGWAPPPEGERPC